MLLDGEQKCSIELDADGPIKSIECSEELVIKEPTRQHLSRVEVTTKLIHLGDESSSNLEPCKHSYCLLRCPQVYF